MDKNHLSTVHLKGEKICFYLLEYSKPDGRDKLRGCIAEEHYNLIANAYPNIIDTYAPISKALRRSANTPSRLGSLPGAANDD